MIPFDIICEIGEYIPVELRLLSRYFLERMDTCYNNLDIKHFVDNSANWREYLIAMMITPTITALRYYFKNEYPIKRLDQPRLQSPGFERCWQTTNKGERCRHLVGNESSNHCWVHRMRPTSVVAGPIFRFGGTMNPKIIQDVYLN